MKEQENEKKLIISVHDYATYTRQELSLFKQPSKKEVRLNRLGSSFERKAKRLSQVGQWTRRQRTNRNTRYLDQTGTYFTVVTSSLWNAVFKMPIFMSDKDRWMKFKCLSKFDQNSLADGTTLYEFATLFQYIVHFLDPLLQKAL